MTAATTTVFGSSIKRREDPKLITGQGTYVDDIKLVGMLHAAIVRSPHAHARILNVDTSRAKNRPGVVAVFTGAELQEPSLAANSPPTSRLMLALAPVNWKCFHETIRAS